MKPARRHFAVIAAKAENHSAMPRIPALIVTTGRAWITKKNYVD